MPAQASRRSLQENKHITEKWENYQNDKIKRRKKEEEQSTVPVFNNPRG